MSPAQGSTLPGTPGPSLVALWGSLSPQEQDALRAHLLGGTSAEWVAATLRSVGKQISATTIKVYRRALARTECAS